MDKTKLFLDDCTALLIKIQTSLGELHPGEKNKDILDVMIRDLHSLKAIAGMMEYMDMANFAYEWEDVVKLCSDGEIVVTRDVLDVFSKCYDVLADMSYEIIVETFHTFITETDEKEQKMKSAAQLLDKIKERKEKPSAAKTAGERSTKVAAASVTAPATSPDAQSLYRLELPLREIDFEKFADFMRNLNAFGTVYSITPETPSIITNASDVVSLLFRTHKTQKAIANSLSSYGIAIKITEIGSQASTDETPFLDELHFLFYAIESGRTNATFINKFKSDRVLSINSFIKDLESGVVNDAQQLGKNVAVEVDDKDVFIDKSIVELLRESLLLIMRNAITHGIEMPDERRTQRKPERGRIWIKKYFEGSLTVLEIGDDGRGIDIEKIREKSAETLKWHLNDDSDKKVLALLFEKGVSTLDKANIKAGRGVGLTRVKENVEKLGGSIIVLTKKGKGTRFFIKFPRNSIIVKGIKIEIKTRQYLIPFFYLKMPYSIGDRKIAVMGRDIAVDRIIGEDEIGIVPSDIGTLNIADNSIPIVKIRRPTQDGMA